MAIPQSLVVQANFAVADFAEVGVLVRPRSRASQDCHRKMAARA